MPGIHIYSSNRLEILAAAFAGLIQAVPLEPLETETVLVQSRGMARWLAMETAARLNIWANSDCPFPNTFIRTIYRLLLPDISDGSAFHKENSLWHLMALLEEVGQEKEFSRVAAYLGSGDELKLYQLARETADLFDQYTLFRPQMILAWDENSGSVPAEQAWQARLWSRLANRIQPNQTPPEPHRARLLQLFERKMAERRALPGDLPARLSVFGISSLPPYHLRVLAALAPYIDIHVFIMNPCREYWFDIVPDRDIVKISRREPVDQAALHLHQGNSLLASMGHLGRDFMALLQELQTTEHDLSSDPGRDSLLACIQQDILNLRENRTVSPGPARAPGLIREDDASVVFHSCHSPIREVEILHDQLLALFDRNHAPGAIEPRDILVMAPEIEEYAPLIRAVFDAERIALQKIPYAIADQSVRKTSKYLETFLALLQLPHGRFSSIEVMNILEAESVRRRFGIGEPDLPLIEHWLDEAGIRWGIDQDHKADLELPPDRENTWRHGLDRLLLGYAMPGGDRILFEDILPYDQVEGDSSRLLGNLLDFTETVFSLLPKLRQQHSLAEWSAILLEMQHRLLSAGEESEADERVLYRLLISLRESQDRTFFSRKIGLAVVRSFLISSLEDHFSPLAGATGFLAGGVTFCSMLPMRAIPFKVIYLLGLNDGVFPRAGRRRSFDLMALEPKRGDRSKRYDDRYLFLETLLSARDRLVISYVGQSVQDNTGRPPSVLVSELMDYIDQNYTRQDDPGRRDNGLSARLTTRHHLQPFHPVYFQPRNRGEPQDYFSYSTDNCEAAAALRSGVRSTVPLFSGPLPPPAAEFFQVELAELVRFFNHPARYLLVQRVGIAPVEESRILETVEPFQLAGLARYKLENSILAHLMNHEDCEELYRLKKAAGELPHGRLGRICFDRLLAELLPFHRLLTELLDGREVEKLPVALRLGDFRLSGHLDRVSGLGLLHYRYGAMTPKDVIRSWLSHLVLNSLDPDLLPARTASAPTARYLKAACTWKTCCASIGRGLPNRCPFSPRPPMPMPGKSAATKARPRQCARLLWPGRATVSITGGRNWTLITAGAGST